MLDISEIEDISNILNTYETKDLVKLIPKDKTIDFKDYKNKEYFVFVANIEIDDEIHSSGKNKNKKKRNTLIRFVPEINRKEYAKICEWLYIFTINDRIVKIGGTRIGLKGRSGSYLCGHHIPQRGKSGDCSKTNAYIYNTFEFYLKQGCTVAMYGYELPKAFVDVVILGKSEKIAAQVFHVYESKFIEDYKSQYNEYPILCDNCDPVYKDKSKSPRKSRAQRKQKAGQLVILDDASAQIEEIAPSKEDDSIEILEKLSQSFGNKLEITN